MKYLIFIIFLTGCAVTGHISEDRRTIVLKGWGATSAEWTADGGAKISKEEPIRTPDLIPTR